MTLTKLDNPFCWICAACVLDVWITDFGFFVAGSLLEWESPHGPSWGHHGACWGHLGASWGHLGAILVLLGASWGRIVVDFVEILIFPRFFDGSVMVLWRVLPRKL